jgi:hypothetical protein
MVLPPDLEMAIHIQPFHGCFYNLKVYFQRLHLE